MKAVKAIELVVRYGELNRQIKSATKEISSNLELCQGLDGKRLVMNGIFVASREHDGKNRDKSTHLWHWYRPIVEDDGSMYPQETWQCVTEELHMAECHHCYAAHLAIQKRKELRKLFGNTKRSISNFKEPK